MSFVKVYFIVLWTLLICDIIILTPGVQLFSKQEWLSGKASKSGGERSSNLFEIETLVFLDSILEQSIKDSSKTSVHEYIQIFFNSVNLILKKSHPTDQTFPDISVKVVDIKVLSDAVETFLFKPVDIENDPWTIDIEQSLKNLKKVAGKGKKYDKYDHVMVLTGRDLYREDQGVYKPDVLGVAFLGGACSKVETDGKYKSLSLVEDVGALFLGVYPAAHELTHNMATKHDSIKPDADSECKAKWGYIMAPQTSQTDKMFQFSHCSLESLRTFLHSEQAECMTKSDFKPIFPEDSAKLPGDVYSMQEICEELASLDFENEVHLEAFVNPSKSPDALCRQISCKVILSSGRRVKLERAVAPGENMACGEGGKCKSGFCM